MTTPPTSRWKYLPEVDGVSVSLAEDGKRAWRSSGDASIDLVLMDLQMPVMDGETATRQIRAWETELGQEHLPVIALTAGAFKEDRLGDTRRDGRFLTKPLDLDELQKALARRLPSIAEVPASPARLIQPVDVPRIKASWRTSFPLLSENSFSAIAGFRELQEALAGAPRT